MVAAAAAALLSGVGVAQTQAPGYGALDFEPPAVGSYRLPPLGRAADGRVLDTDGGGQRLHRLFGDEVTLLSFIYTGCGEINGCPLAAYVFQNTLRALKREGLSDQVRALSVSFDPLRDTPEVLDRYSHWFRQEHPNWRFATTAGDDELLPLLDAYGQNRIDEIDASGRRSGAFAHTLRVFLIDRERRIRNVYSVDFLHPDVIVNDVKTLLAETTAPSADEPAVSPPPPPPPLSSSISTSRIPLGLPPLPIPADNPQSDARIALGQRLFFDRRLSLNNTLSCAMCHVPEQGFAHNEMATAVGFEGRTVRRNAPTLFNVGYRRHLFHDGRESTLERQAWQPLLAANEMANPSIGVVIDKINAIPDYRGLFDAAFGRGAGMETVGQALAAYQRTLLLGNSPFDRWRYRGEEDALSDDAKAGFELFGGRAGCSGCHRIGDDDALFSDGELHNTGIGWRQTMRPEPPTHKVRLAPGVFADVASALINRAAEPPPSDLGRYEITQDPADRWRYSTPSLRNVALTAPYMHDGSLRTLAEVVAYYNDGGYRHPQLDPRIEPLGLSAAEQRQLVLFLLSLTGDRDDLSRQIARARAVPIGDVGAADPHYSHRNLPQESP